jgi:HlyD family secretion protein
MTPDQTNLVPWKARAWHWARAHPRLAAGLGGGLLLLLALLLFRGGGPTGPAAFVELKRSDMVISVVEGGTLEAVNEVVIRNEVEGTSRIIYIVPEGSYVKKGDLLVELDTSAAQDQLNQQQIAFEKAQFALVQAEQQLEIQKSTVDSEVRAAELKVEFAQLEVKKYIEGGAQQERRNAEIQITNVLEKLRIAQERAEWSEKLFKEGYETKSTLDTDRLTVSQSRLSLEQAETALRIFEEFEFPRNKRQLEAAWQEAQEDLERVKLTGERKLAQFKADVETQKSTLELNRERLERDRAQLLAARITAPQDGLVVYATGSGRWSSESLIEEGATVRNRQELIKLPDVSSMKVNLKVHESYVTMVRPGQRAFVVLDSMPDRRFQGEVRYIAVLPDSGSRWANPNLKLYLTEIRITDPLPDVKPGVSARAEIIVTNLQDVLAVPLQAVTTRRGAQVVFLADKPQTPVPVTVGLYNSKMIQLVDGVREGDRVLLAPPLDAETKDLGGAIIGVGEALPPQNTNGAPRVNGDAPARAAPPVAEREPGRGAGTGAPGGTNGAPRFNREEMMKRFDKDGDGQLSEAERAAMREQFGGGGAGGGGNRRRGTNAPAIPPAP